MKHIFHSIIVVLLGAFLLTGCVGSKSAQPGGFSLKTSANGPMLEKIEKPTNGNALIYVFRIHPKSKFFQKSHEIYVNGKFVSDFRLDGFYPLHVRPGHYTITIDDPDADDVDKNKKISGNVEAGEVYFAGALIDVKDKSVTGYGASFASRTFTKKTWGLLGTKLTASREEDISKLVTFKKDVNRVVDDGSTQKAAAKGALGGALDSLDSSVKAIGNSIKVDTDNLLQGAGVGMVLDGVTSAVKGKSSAYKDLIYNGIANYDMNYLFKGEEYFPDIKNPTREQKIKYLKKNGLNIQYIKNPDEELQLIAIKQDLNALKYIKNPTNEVKLFSSQSSKDYYLKGKDKKRVSLVTIVRDLHVMNSSKDFNVYVSDKYNKKLRVGSLANGKALNLYLEPGKAKLTFLMSGLSSANQNIELDIEANNKYCINNSYVKKAGMFSQSYELQTALVDNIDCAKSIPQKVVIQDSFKKVQTKKNNLTYNSKEYYSINSEKKDYAKVFILRPDKSTASGKDLEIYLTDKYNNKLELDRLPNASILPLKVDPGKVKFNFHIGYVNVPDHFLTFNVLAGKEYCLKDTISFWSGEFEPLLVDMSECKKALKEFQQVL